MLPQRIALSLCLCLFTSPAQAVVRTEHVQYTSADGAVMRGLLAYDDAQAVKRPGILIVPDWMGVAQPYPRERATLLAQQGYVAMVADIYGQDVRPANTDEAARLATLYKTNRPLLRERVGAAYDALTRLARVNVDRVVAIGYCFGGTAALELARSGVPLRGTVSFHGGLATATPQDAERIQGPVLVLHGAADPFVPPEEVAAFKKEMDAANVDMRFVAYPGAVHSFTLPTAGGDASTGAAYNAQADQDSWLAFQNFLKEVL